MNLQGNSVKLEDWQAPAYSLFGRKTCGHCIMELKMFEKNADAHPNRVQLIAINVDGEKSRYASGRK